MACFDYSNQAFFISNLKKGTQNMRGKTIEGFATREQVLSDLFTAWKPVYDTEYVPLTKATGRITAQDICAELSMPVYRTSGCDGIAVKSLSFSNGMPDYSKWKENVDFASADTGDDFDDAFDAVIMAEEVDRADDGTIVYISEDISVNAGDNVFKAGSSVKKGELLLKADTKILAKDTAALALSGCRMVPVRRKPRVAFIPTGSELVSSCTTPRRGQNVDSNSLFMEESLRELGAEPLLFPIIIDNKQQLSDALDMALKTADIVIVNGGTARGAEDFNVTMLQSRGVLLHHYVAAAPGRPMALGIVKEKPVIILPGPALAALHGFHWCISALVCRALHIPVPHGTMVRCTLKEELGPTPHMAIMCLMEITRGENGEFFAQPLSFKGGGMIHCLTANGMYISPIGAPHRKAGEQIEVELLRGEECIC